MAARKMRKALGAVKDQTSIGLAKAGSSTVLAELEVAIVKATRHEEFPAEEKHVRDILSLASLSRANIAACVALLSRRLGRTRNWAVALKALVLVHRLLADGDPVYEQEVFFATRRGTRMLNMADFRDAGSRAGGWDFSAFVRTYARYLDERLEGRMLGRRGPAVGSPGRRTVMEEEGGAGETPVKDMRADRLFAKAHRLQVLLDRLLACRPAGAARDNRIVAMALYPTVKESFQLYFDLTEITAAFVGRFTELTVPDCVRVHDLFTKLSKQFEELDSFYTWSRSAGIARASDYPEIEHITNTNLQVMEDFIRGCSSLPGPHVPRQPAAGAPDPVVDVDEVGDKGLEMPVFEESESNEERVLEEESGKELVAVAAVEVVAPAEGSEKLADFLNLQVDVPTTTNQNSDSFALTLFDGNPAAPQPWEAFKDTPDWEKALVESASNLAGQKPALAGGFDMLTLESMYNHGNLQMSSAADGVDGSASSMVAAGRSLPEILALPAPVETRVSLSGGSGDPFEASAAVAPPAWVQMSEMEKKQRLLADEQLMWQQYARDGMQGKLPARGGGACSYNVGGYTQRF